MFVTGLYTYIYCNRHTHINRRRRGHHPDPAAALARARARGGATDEPPHLDVQKLESTRLHPVGRRQELHDAGRPRLGARAVRTLRRRSSSHGAEPVDQGQPAVVSPRNRHEFRHGRRLGPVGEPLDRRGEPAQHRAARLPGGDPLSRPVRSGETPDGAGHERLQSRSEPPGHPLRGEPVRLRRLCLVPGIGHPCLTPQHRQSLQRHDRRPADGQVVARREPAHDLLPRRHRSRPRGRAEPGDDVDTSRSAQFPDARFHSPRIPPQGRDHRGRRCLRPTHPPRRSGDAGLEEVAHLRARRLQRRGCPVARRPRGPRQGTGGHVRQIRGVQAALPRQGSPQVRGHQRRQSAQDRRHVRHQPTLTANAGPRMP